MPLRPLKSFLPTADDVLNAELPTLGPIVLQHLKSYEGLNTVWQHGGLNRGYFLGMLENRNMYLGVIMPKDPEYGARQPEVTEAVMGAWSWLVGQGILMPNPDQPSGEWFVISPAGKKLLQRLARYERFEELGPDQVEADLKATGGAGLIGSQEVVQIAWEWLRMKKGNPPAAVTVAHSAELIAPSRLVELRQLGSSQFDFKKLIRLCEEINSSYSNGNYLATAMLTRSLLDHVPPLFSKNNFGEVASNYGGASFKGTMQHLQNASRNVADGHLHQQIRKSETLPTAQQVNCGQQLDTLLAEIVRITS